MTPEDKADMGWKEEMSKRIIDYLVSHGSPVSEHPSYYGWVDERWESLYRHLKDCPLDYGKCFYEDTEWQAFAGTFAEESKSFRKGIKVTVTCSCGEISGRHWRVEDGSYAEMLREITKG